MSSSLDRACRLALLSSSIAGCFGASMNVCAAPRAPALLFVTNCDDSGPGSLRDTVASAVSGDAIELGQMGCSTLTLTTGAIVVPQDDLTIKYSAENHRATISGSYQGRVFQHNGAGSLEIDHLIVSKGKYTANGGFAHGGCINSAQGTIVLYGSTVTHCSLVNQNGDAMGGGIAANEIAVYNSEITGNEVNAHGYYGAAAGGGLFAHFGAIRYSSIVSNSVLADYRGFGGGVRLDLVGGQTHIDHSLIALNQSSTTGGGLHAQNTSAGSLQLDDVTFYGNSARLGGGFNLYGTSTEIHNVTIANNVISNPPPNYGESSAFSAFETTLSLSSSIIAGNQTVGDPGDNQVRVVDVTSTLDHDLVFGPSGIDLPVDTITTDPLLLPLAQNGGDTMTVAVRSDSPAVDHGIASDGLTTDQRGPGFARLIGSAVDIGAFERQGPNDGDFISVGGFDPP